MGTDGGADAGGAMPRVGIYVLFDDLEGDDLLMYTNFWLFNRFFALGY